MFQYLHVPKFAHHAYTLSPEFVLENHNIETGTFTRTHSDGWTITGEICEDWYYWVNEFTAEHPTLGKVWGDFEHTVNADSEEGYNAFYAAYTPDTWDYLDI